MPVMIERKDWPLWLGETEGDPGKPLRSLAENVLRVWSIGKAVGNVKNDGPELLEPTTRAISLTCDAVRRCWRRWVNGRTADTDRAASCRLLH
jgi:hypothetical protein